MLQHFHGLVVETAVDEEFGRFLEIEDDEAEDVLRLKSIASLNTPTMCYAICS